MTARYLRASDDHDCMLNKTSWVLLLALGSVLFFTACQQEQQVKAIVDHEAKHPGIKKKYVYQSLIRLANVKQDENFEKLIKDVRKVILYMPPGDDSTYQITALRPAIREEGFEELIDVRTSDAQRISLWVKEANGRDKYIALVDSESDDIILEIDGTIHPEYLASIATADQSSLTDLLKGGFQ
jgi:hypothetical protein